MNAAVRRIRDEIADISDDVASLTSTLIRLGEQSDWTDPRIDLIERAIKCFEHQRATLATMIRVIETEQVKAIKRLAAMVNPPTACPGCLAGTGQQWPEGHTAKHCDEHLEELRQAVAARRRNTEAAA